MPEQMITCPKCGTKIELTQALTETIRNSLRADVEADAAKRQAELVKQQKAVAAQEKQLAEREQAMEETVEELLRTERETLRKATLKKAEKEYAAKANSLEAELKEKAEKLANAERRELEFRKKERGIEEERQALGLEVERRIGAERDKLRKEAAAKAEREYAERSEVIPNVWTTLGVG